MLWCISFLTSNLVGGLENDSKNKAQELLVQYANSFTLAW